MENKDKFKIALTLACFAAISIFFTAQYRKHRKQKQCRNTCYLKSEAKPQTSFKRVLADNSYSQFKHLKLEPDSTANEDFSNLHPYKDEISSLMKNTDIEFEFCDGNMDFKTSDKYVWVETESQLKELVAVLSKQRVFAVDTEQHSLRSFLGFTALIQVSTRIEDYLVDTIALHDVMGILRPVFANPNICKVFHGADNDILWLQRDFHIYVVNLFDTAKACDVLAKPQKSLAYLLETYCCVATNKLLQREDWRQRPLPVEMLEYARTDAHYLLYIAHCLSHEFIQLGKKNSACPDDEFHFLLEASRRSNAICLQLFSKENEASPGESAASSIISRHLNDQGRVSLTPSDTKFQDILRRICAWRDLMARLHDESLRFVLSDHAIVALAEKVPTNEVDIYNTISQADLSVDFLIFNSSHQSPSPVICSHWEDLVFLFQDKISGLDDIFRKIPQKHLGRNGSCPLSAYNYALLSKSNLKLTEGLTFKRNRSQNAKQYVRKASRALFVQKFSCKSPVYHNCRIYANDGRLLCYCDRRKLEWYLRRDLAKLVEEDPPAIMLLFEPKGRPEDEGNNFYIQSKRNICVGCGEGKHYLRYRIIPSCYRVHFPEHLKSHRSHDIVLLCVDCHEVAHTAAERHKKEISAQFGIPLYVRKVVDSSQANDISQAAPGAVNLEEAGVSPLELRTAAMALLRHGERMPFKRREELTQIVMKFYGGREISKEDLERALLVGMSPHERRRLEKKKGMSLKHTMGTTSDETLENNRTKNASDLDNVNSFQMMERETCIKENGGPLIETNMDVCSPNICPESVTNGEASSEVSETVNIDESENSVSSVHSNSDGNLARKTGSKLSLLGHGPHGRQVVDHLLMEYGEDGIRLFCQRWRQVFVEAIRPRFLPAGWDVMHRREFGDFSVYNPSKKDSAVD